MRPIRNRNPDIFRLITIRTCEARLWISPTSNVKKLIGGIIARYQEIFEVELFAYNVLGNHMHLVAKAPKSNIDEFCENVNREIAKRINWRHKREGKFWGRRYDDQQILTQDDLLEAFLYVTTNPSKHGLVSNSQDWPGLNSYEQSLTEKDRCFSFNHYSKEPRVTKHKLKLSVLPALKELSKKKRAELLTKLLSERSAQIAKDRGKSFLGLQALLDQEPGEKPANVSKSPRPRCYTKCSELRRNFREIDRARRDAYSYASMLYRVGRKATFPEFTFKPPLHRAPRVVPFKPLTAEHFKNAA